MTLVGQLPPTSRFNAARAMDPEVARAVLAQPETGDEEPWAPPLTEWDTATALAAETRDLLMDAVKLLSAIRFGIPVVQQERLRPAPKAGGKPFPRPVTAIEKAREEAARDAGQRVLAWFFPHATNN